MEGKIKLRLRLGTREDRGLSEEDNSVDIKQQRQLLNVFIDRELSKLGSQTNKEWSGNLSREAETILHQHAIQGDVTDLQISMW